MKIQTKLLKIGAEHHLSKNLRYTFLMRMIQIDLINLISMNPVQLYNQSSQNYKLSISTATFILQLFHKTGLINAE